MKCKLCNSKNIKVTYKGVIRDGMVGNYTSKPVQMYECIDCLTIWHEDDISHETYYETTEYREKLEGTSDIEEFYKIHDYESQEKFRYTGTEIFRNKVVADIGCGGGAFCDYLNVVAKTIIAVEPSEVYRRQMMKKGYETFPYAIQAIEKYKEEVDVVVSFDVIEHVNNPTEFVKDIYDLLKKDGLAIIGTPTDAPVMRELLGQEYEKFLFSTQHPWVLREESFRCICRNLEIKNYEIKYYQRYGLSNLVHWIVNKMPGNHMRYSFISDSVETIWKAELERQGLSDYICIEIRK